MTYGISSTTYYCLADSPASVRGLQMNAVGLCRYIRWHHQCPQSLQAAPTSWRPPRQYFPLCVELLVLCPWKSCLGKNHWALVALRSARSSGPPQEDGHDQCYRGVTPAAVQALWGWSWPYPPACTAPVGQTTRIWASPKVRCQEAVPGLFFSLEVAWFSHLQDLIIHFAWIWIRTKCRWRNLSLLPWEWVPACSSQVSAILSWVLLTLGLHFPHLLQGTWQSSLSMGHCSIQAALWVSLLPLQYLGLGKGKASLSWSVLQVLYACVHVVCVWWAMGHRLVIAGWTMKDEKNFQRMQICNQREKRGSAREEPVRCSTYVQPTGFAGL